MDSAGIAISSLRSGNAAHAVTFDDASSRQKKWIEVPVPYVQILVFLIAFIIW